MRDFPCTFLFCIAVQFGPTLLFAGDDGLREAKESLASLRRLVLGGSRGEIRQEHAIYEQGLGSEPSRMTVTHHFAFQDDSSALERRQTAEDGTVFEAVVGINDDYTFRLRRSGSSEPWKIDELHLDATTRALIGRQFASDERRAQTPQHLQYVDVFGFLAIEGLPIEDLLKDCVVECDSREENLIFTLKERRCLPQMPGELVEAKIVFINQSGWRIDHYEALIAIENEFDGFRGTYKQRSSFRWARSPSDPFVTAAVSYDGVPAANFSGGTAVFEVKALLTETIPDSRFRLSHYGLPEPALPPKRSLIKAIIVITLVLTVTIVFVKRVIVAPRIVAHTTRES